MAVQSDGLLEIQSFLTSILTRFGGEIGSVCRLFELILSAGNVHGFGDNLGHC